MEWLRYGAQHYPNRICINEYTYNDIYRGVVHVARKLEPLQASRIAILSDNSVMMAIYVLATMVVHKELLLLNQFLVLLPFLNLVFQLFLSSLRLCISLVFL